MLSCNSFRLRVANIAKLFSSCLLAQPRAADADIFFYSFIHLFNLFIYFSFFFFVFVTKRYGNVHWVDIFLFDPFKIK